MIIKIVAKYHLTLVFLVILFFTASSTSAIPTFAQKFLNSEELDFIKQHPVINVGGLKDWPPFDFIDTKGQYNGVCHNYLKLITDKTGLQFTVKTDSWSQHLIQMDAGTIDLLPAIYLNPEREAKYHFTDSYHQISEYVFARNNVLATKPKDLFGKTIAVVKGFPTISIIKVHYPKINILEVKSIEAAIDAVITYQADFLIDGLEKISHHLREKSITQIRPVFSLSNHQEQKIYMASRQELPQLASIISKVINHLGSDEKQQLLSPWFQYEKPKKKKNTIRLELNSQEQAYLNEHPVLHWGFDTDWKPIEFFSKKEGVVKGIAADYVNHVERVLGVNIKAVEPNTWGNMLAGIKQHKIDFLSTVVKTKERENYLLFTKPYLDFPMVVISKEKRPYMSHFSMLSGLTIAVAKNNTPHEILQEKHPSFKLHVVNDTNKGLLAVSQGQADVFVGNLATSVYEMTHTGLTHLEVVGHTSHNYLLSFAVSQPETILKNILQKALETMTEEEKNTIYKKWLQIPYQEFDLRILWAILFGGGFILCLFFFWNRKLVELNQTINNYVNIIDTHVVTITFNRNSIITSVSNAFCHATGYKRKELLGKDYHFLTPPHKESFKWNEFHRRQFLTHNVWKGEIKIQHINGSFFWLDMMVTSKLKHKKHIAFTAIGHDITDKKILEITAITDELTGLYNRRHLNNLFEPERNRSMRDQKLFVFMMIDIDNFKKYNDHYGHQKGDIALIAVAKTVKNTFKRSSDSAFRLGGEEFACLISLSDITNVANMAEKVRANVENIQIEHENNLPYGVITISIGVYCMLHNDNKNSLEHIYNEADKLLYKAKKQGKNRAVLHQA